MKELQGRVAVVTGAARNIGRAIALELGSRGSGRYETLIAIPIDDFIAAL